MARNLLIAGGVLAVPVVVLWVLLGWLLIDEGVCDRSVAWLPIALALLGIAMLVRALQLGFARRSVGVGWTMLVGFGILLFVSMAVTFACG